MTGLITQLSQSQWSMMSSTNGGGPVGVLVPQTFISVCICTVYWCICQMCTVCISVYQCEFVLCVLCVFCVYLSDVSSSWAAVSRGVLAHFSNLIWEQLVCLDSFTFHFELKKEEKLRNQMKLNKPENPNRHFSCLFNISSVICLLTFSLCPKMKTLYLHNVKFPGNFEVNSADYTHVILLFIQQSTN